MQRGRNTMCPTIPSAWLLQLAAVAAAVAAIAMGPAASAFSISMVSSAPGAASQKLVPRTQPANEEAFRQMQQAHRPIASSFAPSEFNPHPALDDCHLQTISGVFLRKHPDCAYVTSPGWGGLAKSLSAAQSHIQPAGHDAARGAAFWDDRRRITTGCGNDFYTVDIKYAGDGEKRSTYQSANGKGTVVILHGLESNSNTSLSTDLAQAYVDEGYDAICMNFRGCCGTPNESLGGYHLGFTDDLRHFLQLLSELAQSEEEDFEKRPVYLSGFSLGANIVVKCLGELGDAAMSLYNVHGAAVSGAPFNQERNQKCVDAPGFNRAIYSGTLLKNLKKRAEVQLDMFCGNDPMTDLFDFQGCMSATTIAEFENSFIAKVYGFEDNVDYYRQNSCYYFLPGVAVPLFILNAKDDPFFDPDFFPIEESVDGGSLAPIKMARTEKGGHLGFMFHQPNDADMNNKRETSWMPIELARFISHVHNYGTE